jgi:hypothetical protein
MMQNQFTTLKLFLQGTEKMVNKIKEIDQW